MIFKERSMTMLFNETTNYELTLPSQTCQRHLETWATNVWDWSTRSITPCLSLLFFSRWAFTMHKPD